MTQELFNELREDLKRDQLKMLWEKYGSMLIAACVAIVIGTGVGVALKSYRAGQNQLETGRLLQALSPAEEKARQQALEAFATASGSHPQATLARLRLAAMDNASGDAKAALGQYEAAAKTAQDEGLQNLSRVLATHVAAGNGLENSSGDVKPGTAFYQEWREAEAWQLYAQGKTADALARFGALKDDVDVPMPIRQRMQVVTSFLSPEESSK